MRRHGWLGLACAGLAALGAAADAAERRPNVVLFLVDDMGWMDSGAYGSKYYETPAMDRFATQAMRFTRAYSQPLCSPTRASILSGQYSSRHGVTSATGHQPPQPPGHSFLPAKAPANQPLLMPESKNYLDPSVVTLAEALRESGYRTAHIGKWHLGTTGPHWPEAQGFDVAFHCHPDPGPPGEYFSPYGVVPPGSPPPADRRQKHVVGTITDGPAGEYIVDRLADEAIRFIESSKDRPFFLNLWNYGVHGPWGHKEETTREFAKKTDPRGVQGNPIMGSMLRSVDECFGRILAKLDELKLADDTVVIFYSDNGGNIHSNTPDDGKQANIKPGHPKYAFLEGWRKWAGDRPPTCNAPLRDGKGRMYEGGVRVPLMVRWPGKIAGGGTSDAIVGCIDMYPTILDLLGVRTPAQHTVDGVSFAPVLKGTGGLARDAYFIWFPHLVPGVSVHQGDWKLIRRFQERPGDYEGTRELFNLKDDPGETTNLAAKMPEKVKELDARIDRFAAETGALLPQPNPDYKPRPAAAVGATKAPASADPAAGLVPKSCRITVVAGALRVEAEGKAPFLGTAQVKSSGPLTLALRARSAAGGAGKVQWVTKDQEDFPKEGQVVPFTLPAGADWQDVTVEVPMKGETRILRLYLPADKGPVEVESIRWTPAKAAKPARAWQFGAARP
ncbi:MAG: sulfatase [Lentisphaerae bacterium]|nr:sulfatase [Lentisphaerota bacterium]